MPETDAVTNVQAVPSPSRSLSAAWMPRGFLSCVVVDLDAVADNVATLRGAAPGATLMAAVKADGYGHGMLPVARTVLRAGATWLGVAHLAEALDLRAAGIDAPVLAWLTVPGDRFAEAVTAHVDIGVSARWALDEVAAAVLATGVTARIHLKVDTGIARNGCLPADLPDLLAAACRHQAAGVLDIVGVFSHLACADVPSHPSVAAQIATFADAVALVERSGAQLELRHLANSAATLAVPAARFDAVRPGLGLYGLSPMPDLATSAQLGLRPAMSLLGRIAMVKDVPPGQGVSYGLTYVTTTDTTLALVPIGYGDGLPRHASGLGPVLIGNRRVTIAGRVCMDQIVLDLGARTDAVQPGDLAVLFGSGADGEPTAQDWAQAAGTISYEIVTQLGARIPRHYVGRQVSDATGNVTAAYGADDGAPVTEREGRP